MKKFLKNKIDTLSDIFCALIGGVPEKDEEIKAFLTENVDFAELLNHRDIEYIIHYHGYFPKETLKAIYSVLPPLVTVANGKKYAIFERTFAKLNEKESKRPDSRSINVDMQNAYRAFMLKYVHKYRIMKKNQSKYRSSNDRMLHPEAQKEAYKIRRQKMSEDEKEIVRMKAKEYQRKWRAENPEKVAVAAEKQKERRKNRTPLQIVGDRIISRKANRKYRENNREQINLRRREKRLILKEQNPELLKEMDRKTNSFPNRSKTCQTYYQKHKDKINQRCKNNPKVALYKRRYQNKKRWQEKTGEKVMSLLQAIINAKQR